jgi:hypothetical protein
VIFNRNFNSKSIGSWTCRISAKRIKFFFPSTNNYFFSKTKKNVTWKRKMCEKSASMEGKKIKCEQEWERERKNVAEKSIRLCLPMKLFRFLWRQLPNFFPDFFSSCTILSRIKIFYSLFFECSFDISQDFIYFLILHIVTHSSLLSIFFFCMFFSIQLQVLIWVKNYFQLYFFIT